MGAEDLCILIATLGRVHQQETLTWLPPVWLERTWLVVPEAEAAQHTYPRLLVHNEQGLGPTRHWAVEHAPTERILSLDDDLSFCARRQHNPPRLRKATPGDMDRMLTAIDSILSTHAALVGIGPRQHNDKHAESYGWNCGLDRAVAVDRRILREMQFEYPVDLMEHLDLSLTTLRAGLRTVQLYEWAQDQSGSNTDGGCSTYRTQERHEQAARKLAARHPDHVSLVQKTAKKGWFGDGTPRVDVVCRWQDAYRDGAAMRYGLIPQTPVLPAEWFATVPA